MVNAQGVLTRIPYAFYTTFIAVEQWVHWLRSVIPQSFYDCMRTVNEDPHGACVRPGAGAALRAVAVFYAAILLRGKTA